MKRWLRHIKVRVLSESKGGSNVGSLSFSIFPKAFEAHVFSGLFQVMKPTRTFSETFPTWPRTTRRSSNAAVLTRSLNQLPLHLLIPQCSTTYFQAHIEKIHLSGMQMHSLSLSRWLPATCSVTAQLVLTSEGTNGTVNSLCEHVRAEQSCPSGNTATALWDQREVSVAEGSTITLPKVFLLKPVNQFFYFFFSFFL